MFLVLKNYINTQQKQTCIHNKIYYRFGQLLRPPAWKQNGPILEEKDN